MPSFKKTQILIKDNHPIYENTIPHKKAAPAPDVATQHEPKTHLDVRVQRNVLLETEVLELGDEVPGHREQKQRVAEGQGSGGAPRDGDAHAHDVSEVGVLRHEGVVCGQVGNGLMDGWMERGGKREGRMDGWVDRCVSGQIDRWMDGYI